MGPVVKSMRRGADTDTAMVRPSTSQHLPDATERVALLPAAGVLALWGALMPAAGGFDPSDWLLAGLGLIGLLVVSAVGAGRLIPDGTAPRAALGALGALTVLSFASIAWSDAPGSSWEAADLLLTTLLAAWTLALVRWRAGTAAVFFGAFSAVAALVCAVTFVSAMGATDLTTRFT